jgi:acyl-CoA synthetase (NDP forming)
MELRKGENTALEVFFTPQHIAVIGASNKEGKMGNLFVRRLLTRFPGRISLVHPKEQMIMGVSAYPDINAIPEPIDLVIPLIPQEQLLTLLRSCENGKVKFLLAIPSGFGEVPVVGKRLERELIRLAKERDIRVIGPNSMGMLNCPYGLNASMVPEQPPGGAGFSCITQSGGFGMAIYMYANDHQLQMAKICDLGNTADVQVYELLQYLSHDIDTRIVGLFLESVSDQEAFFSHASALAAQKPLIFTKLGRTKEGGRASFAHIGLNPDWLGSQEMDGASKIIHAQSGLEMLHIAKALSWQPLPRGRRVGIITGSGGVGTELADFCVEHGMEVPEFSPQLQDALRPYLPSYASVGNPVDLTPIWWEFPKVYPPLIQTLFASDEVDLLLVTIIDVATTLEDLMYAVGETGSHTEGSISLGKPLYIYWASPYDSLKNMRILEQKRIPCYQSTLEAVRVAAAICKYAM